MTNQTWLAPEQIQELIGRLHKEFPKPEAPLFHRNAFELLIAVILSAQCTDARVNQITPKLFPKDKGCTPKDILDLGEDELKKIIFPCGYYNSKTKAIWGCAELIHKSGAVPSTFEELIHLPGVGAKTAQVILAQWFKQEAFPVDTHIHRVANRLGLAQSGKNRDKTERQVKASVPKKYWSELHLQLVFHGRKTCTAYRPKCGSCPLRDLCQWPNKTA